MQIVLPFARLCGKTLQADFDGGTLTSDGGGLFLRETEAQVGVIRRLVEALDDRRDRRYNPSCHLLKSMGFCLTLKVKSPISPQEEQAHGRQNYRDVLPV
jgi:hypothetical protein